MEPRGSIAGVGANPSAMEESDEARKILEEFDRLSPEDKRRAIARAFGLEDIDRAVFVRKPGGDLVLEQVAPETKAQIDLLAKQGYQTAAFTNRKERRAQKAKARRAKRSRSASGG